MRIKYFLILLIIQSCNNSGETIVHTPKEPRFISVIERLGYRESPDFDYIRNEYSKLNDSISRGVKQFDSLQVTSFITLKEIEDFGNIIYFSNDTLTLDTYLQFITITQGENIKFRFNDLNVLPDQKLNGLNIYYIPVLKLGINKLGINIEGKSTYFNFMGVKSKLINDDSLMNNYYEKLLKRDLPSELDSLEL